MYRDEFDSSSSLGILAGRSGSQTPQFYQSPLFGTNPVYQPIA